MKKIALLFFLLWIIYPRIYSQEKMDSITHPKIKEYSNITDLNAGIMGDYNLYGIRNVSCYNFNSHISLGGGVGLEYYDVKNTSISYEKYLLPIFADIRLNSGEKVATFFMMDIGYSVSLQGAEYGGLLINPVVGLKFNYDYGKAVYIGVGMNYQEFKTDYNGIWTYIYTSAYTNTIYHKVVNFNLKVGFSF